MYHQLLCVRLPIIKHLNIMKRSQTGAHIHFSFQYSPVCFYLFYGLIYLFATPGILLEVFEFFFKCRILSDSFDYFLHPIQLSYIHRNYIYITCQDAIQPPAPCWIEVGPRLAWKSYNIEVGSLPCRGRSE